MTFANAEQAAFWSQMAPTWLEREDRLEEVAGAPGRMAMDRLGLQPGQRVVDIGCGTGQTTLELASRVAPGGEVLGVDIAAEMLVRGRERAEGGGAHNVEFLHAANRIRSVLAAAGFDHVEVMPNNDQIIITEARIAEVALTSTRVGAVREALQDADNQTREQALAAIEDALRARLEHGEVRASRGVLLVVGEATDAPVPN